MEISKRLLSALKSIGLYPIAKEVPNTGEVLTFYIEHISFTTGSNTNTILQLHVKGEVSYTALKEFVQQSLNITDDFELDHTPAHHHERFLHLTVRKEPYIWLYTVPAQEHGAEPWYLHNIRWAFLVRHLPEAQNSETQGVPIQTTTSQQELIQHAYAKLERIPDLLRHVYHSMVDHAVLHRNSLNRTLPPGPNRRAVVFFCCAVVGTLMFLYCSAAHANFPNILEPPTIQDYLASQNLLAGAIFFITIYAFDDIIHDIVSQPRKKATRNPR